MQGYANWRGLVKELGFLFVTQNGFANRANKSCVRFENKPARLCRLPKQERSVLAERSQCSWANVQYLTHVLIVEPFAKPFVCSSTSHCLHL